MVLVVINDLKKKILPFVINIFVGETFMVLEKRTRIHILNMGNVY